MTILQRAYYSNSGVIADCHFETPDLQRTSQEGGNAPADVRAGARFACPLPNLFPSS
jgi:hypothetical protein